MSELPRIHRNVVMEQATTHVELADNDTTAQLLLMTIPARTDVIRKGIEYTARERQCAADALDTQHAAQRTALETEKAQLARTWADAKDTISSVLNFF